MRRPVRRPLSLDDDRTQEFVGVQASLHQELGLALANQLHGPGRGGVAVRDIDHLRSSEVDAARLRDFLDLRRRPHEDWRDQSLRGRIDGARQR